MRSYESNRCWGYYGIAAFLRDVIEDKEDCHMDIGGPNDSCLGVAPKLPWSCDPKLQKMPSTEFAYLLAKYVSMVTDAAINPIKDIGWIVENN